MDQALNIKFEIETACLMEKGPLGYGQLLIMHKEHRVDNNEGTSNCLKDLIQFLEHHWIKKFH